MRYDAQISALRAGDQSLGVLNKGIQTITRCGENSRQLSVLRQASLFQKLKPTYYLAVPITRIRTPKLRVYEDTAISNHGCQARAGRIWRPPAKLMKGETKTQGNFIMIKNSAKQERDSGTGTAHPGFRPALDPHIPVAIILYTIALSDRTNIYLALPKISRGTCIWSATGRNGFSREFSSGVTWPCKSRRASGCCPNMETPNNSSAFCWSLGSVFAVGCGLARTYLRMLLPRYLLEWLKWRFLQLP